MKKSSQFFKNLKPFRLLFLCITPLVFICGKCKKVETTRIRVAIEFEASGNRMAKGCVHPVDLYELSSLNIAGGGLKNKGRGIIGNGAGPWPASSKCTMQTICKTSARTTWSGFGEVIKPNIIKHFADLTSSDFKGNWVFVEAPSEGSFSYHFVLTEPCISSINVSPFLINNMSFPCLPIGALYPRAIWEASVTLSAGDDGKTIYIDGNNAQGICD